MDEEAASLLRGDDAKQVLSALRRLLDAAGDPEEGAAASIPANREGIPEPFAVLIKRIGEQTGMRGKKLYLPIRAAVTGRLHGPEMDRIFALLSPTSLRKRVDKALALT
jgi:glutamyl/glutaminyl-tRNA synthetase